MALQPKSRGAPDYDELREKAGRIFVDREGPKRAFDQALARLQAEPDALHFLSFYGVGGQGKTALFEELCRTLRKRKGPKRVCCANIDLHYNKPDGELHCWVLLRNTISAATGAKFPCFDFAYADYMQQTRPEAPPAVLGASRLAGLRGEHGEDIADAARDGAGEAVKTSFGQLAADLTAEAALAFPLLGPLLKRGVKWSVAKGYETWLKNNKAALDRLYNSSVLATPAELEKALPEILAHELALHQNRRPDSRLAILIDEYENAVPGAGTLSRSLALGKGSWDRGLRQFLRHCRHGSYRPTDGSEAGYDYKTGLLLVLFGRERIVWDKLDEDWAELLRDRQHPLEGLSNSDAEDFLVQAGIGEGGIREVIVESGLAYDPQTRGHAVYPLMLDLAVDIYFALKKDGRRPAPADFQIGGRSYVEKRRELLSRYLRNYPSNVGEILRRLACTREFDRDLTDHLAERHARSFNLESFGLLTSLSFIAQAEDGRGWTIHQHIRDTLLEDLPVAERFETHTTLMQWFHARSSAAAFRDVRLGHAEALGDFYVHAAASGLEEKDLPEIGETQLMARDLPLAPPILRQPALEALAISRRSRPIGHSNIAFSLNFLGAVMWGLGDFDAARDAYEEALIIRRRAPAPDEVSVSRSLNGLGVALSALGKHARALEMFEEVLAIRRRTSDEDHRAVADALHNVGTAMFQLGDQEGARQALEEAMEMRRRVLPPGHPDLALTLTNLGYSLSAMGDVAGAHRALVEALEIRRGALPLDHPEIAESLSSAGESFLQVGDGDAAKKAFEEALDIRRRALPRDHPAIVDTLARLGASLVASDDRRAALEVYEEALEIRRRALAADDPRVAESLEQYGLCLTLLDDLGGAAMALEEALAINQAMLVKLQALLPPDHQEVKAIEAKVAANQFACRWNEDMLLGWRPRATGSDRQARSGRAGAPVQWPLPPPLKGEWRDCEGEEAMAMAATLDSKHRVGDAADQRLFCEAYGVEGFRALPLEFWGKGWLLLEGLARPDGRLATFLALHGAGETWLSLGTVDEIARRNRDGKVDLSNPSKRLAYLRFYCSWVRGEGERFAWIESDEQLAPFVADGDSRRRLAAHCAPAAGGKSRSASGSWRARAAVAYRGALQRAVFELSPDGWVTMTDAPLIDTGGAIVQPEYWEGPFRFLPAG